MFLQKVVNQTCAVAALDADVTVNCPPFADSITEGDIRWEKAVGDSVEVDETIGEVETDKVFYSLL